MDLSPVVVVRSRWCLECSSDLPNSRVPLHVKGQVMSDGVREIQMVADQSAADVLDAVSRFIKQCTSLCNGSETLCTLID